MISRKIIISSLALFTLCLLTIFPKKNNIDIEVSTFYTNDNKLQNIFLLNDYNMLSLTKVISNNIDVELNAKDLLNVLIKDGIGEDIIPNGFKSFIPSSTKILNIDYNDGIIKINFSKDLLDVDVNYEEKVIESIVYTLTSIKDVKGVIISVENELLTYLPKSKKILPEVLTRKFGINKEYDITSIHDISKVTVYYLNKYNDNVYYVPVTKYINEDIEPIEVIIDCLSSSILSNNLISYLNSNINIQNIEKTDNILKLDFNDYIFNDLENESIKEEVINTISLSIEDNYDIDEYIITVDNEEIYRKKM